MLSPQQSASQRVDAGRFSERVEVGEGQRAQSIIQSYILFIHHTVMSIYTVSTICRSYTVSQEVRATSIHYLPKERDLADLGISGHRPRTLFS